MKIPWGKGPIWRNNYPLNFEGFLINFPLKIPGFRGRAYYRPFFFTQDLEGALKKALGIRFFGPNWLIRGSQRRLFPFISQEKIGVGGYRVLPGPLFGSGRSLFGPFGGVPPGCPLFGGLNLGLGARIRGYIERVIFGIGGRDLSLKSFYQEKGPFPFLDKKEGVSFQGGYGFTMGSGGCLKRGR